MPNGAIVFVKFVVSIDWRLFFLLIFLLMYFREKKFHCISKKPLVVSIYIFLLLIDQFWARTSGEWGIGEWGDMWGDMTPSSYIRAEKLSLRFFCHRLFFTDTTSPPFFWFTNIRILRSAVSMVKSSIFAKQTLNQPGSVWWKEEPIDKNGC